MRITMFKTPKPKRFTYKPRYYDEEKDRLERKKAEMGLDSNVSHQESLRLQMSKRWRKGSAKDVSTSKLTKLIYYSFYTFVIVGAVYVIFFTEFVDKLVALFGVGR